MATPDQIHCPKCNSTQVTANKKGFSGTKAAAGAILTGSIGLLAGTIGSKDIVITCLNCGKQFKPGQGAKTTAQQPKLIWDEEQKKHVLNPNFSGADTVSAPLIFVVAFIVLIVIVAYFIFK